MVHLKFTEKSHHSKTMELHVKVIVSNLICWYEIETLDNFTRVFKHEISAIKRTNAYKAEYSYEATHTDKGVEIWHLNSKSDKDRLLGIVELISNN